MGMPDGDEPDEDARDAPEAVGDDELDLDIALAVEGAFRATEGKAPSSSDRTFTLAPCFGFRPRFLGASGSGGGAGNLATALLLTRVMRWSPRSSRPRAIFPAA